jgi:VIT1/CCC1 family predicted Fe2+/Mn2+ transporter
MEAGDVGGGMESESTEHAPRPQAGVGHYLRDIVYGATDGVVTTTAVIAGTAGASFDPRVGVVLGLANLAADGISMGASNYLGLKSELEQSGASVSLEQPWRHGLATTLAFMFAGALPMLSYAVRVVRPEARLWLALAIAALVLGFVGAARARFIRRSALRCAVEVLAVAGGASAIAY